MGRAERLSALGRALSRLEDFDLALSAGELYGLRSRARAALLAGEAAQRAGELERSLGYFELAASDNDTQAAARAALERVRSEIADRLAARAGDDGPEVVATFDLRDDTPLREHVVLEQDDDAPAAPIPLVTTARVLGSGSVPAPSPSAAPPSSAAPSSSAAPLASAPPSSPASLVSPVDSPIPSTKPPSPRKPNLAGTFAGSSAEEVRLHVALADGSREAGHELLRLLAPDASRVHDRVAVYRRLALLTPGDVRSFIAELVRLRGRGQKPRSTRRRSRTCSRLVRGETPADPPPLEDLAVQSDAVRALLFRDTRGPTLEALALVWETAGHLFQRDPGAYGINGLERVQPMAPTPLGRA